MADFIPNSEGNLASWLINYANKIAAVGASCGMTDAEIKVQQAMAENLITQIHNATNAQAESKRATAAKNAQKAESLTGIRANVAHLKANPLWTEALNKDLQTDRTSTTIDTATYKPRIKGRVNGGAVQLRVLKLGVQAINIYVKLQGETSFTLLQRVSLSVFTDTRPLQKPGIAEVRQYMAMGVMSDKEIGLPSDIVTISFGG